MADHSDHTIEFRKLQVGDVSPTEVQREGALIPRQPRNGLQVAFPRTRSQIDAGSIVHPSHLS